MWNRFAPRLRRMIFAALEEAGRRGQDEASAEHLSLVIARDGASAAAFVLDHAGANRGAIIHSIENTLRSDPPRSHRAESLSALALHVLDVANHESQKHNDRHVGTEHVVAALTRIKQGNAALILAEAQITYEKISAGRVAWIRRGMPREHRPSSMGTARYVSRPIFKLRRLLSLGWRVYRQKSIAHPGFATNPYPLYAMLRERWPV